MRTISETEPGRATLGAILRCYRGRPGYWSDVLLAELRRRGEVSPDPDQAEFDAEDAGLRYGFDPRPVVELILRVM